MKKLFFASVFFISSALSAQDLNIKRLDSLFSLLEKYDRAMGSISVAHKGKSVYQKSIGFADEDQKVKATANTTYRIGSLSKMFTATIVMQLIEEGKLSLEEKLSAFYPALPNADQITIKQLLQHTSGISDIIKSRDFENWMLAKRSKEELLSKIKEIGTTSPPGEKRAYSNTNYIILSLIAEDVEHKEFGKILEERILKPLDLKHTYYGDNDGSGKNEASSYKKQDGRWEKVHGIHLSIPMGAGGILSTPEDLNRFINALFDGKLVSEATLALMRKEPGIGMYPIPVLREEEMIGHMGGMDAFQSLLVYMPRQDMTFAFSFNAIDYSYKELVMGIFNILLNKEYVLPELKP